MMPEYEYESSNDKEDTDSTNSNSSSSESCSCSNESSSDESSSDESSSEESSSDESSSEESSSDESSSDESSSDKSSSEESSSEEEPWAYGYMKRHLGVRSRDNDDTDDTHSSDTSDEPTSASDSDNEDPRAPINMGNGHTLTNITNTFFTKDGKVKELTSLTFPTILDKAFVMFYMPGCPHCIAMRPVYQHVMNRFQFESYAISVDETALCKRFHVNSFPTIVYMDHQRITNQYEKGPKEVELKKWVNGITKPNRMTGIKQFLQMLGEKKARQRETNSFFTEGVTELTPDELRALTGESVVMFFAPWCGFCQRAKPVYEELASSKSPLYAINCETYKEVSSLYGIEGFPTFCKIKNDKKMSTFMKETTKENLLQWMNATSKVIEYDETTPLPDSLCITMFYAPWCGHCVTTKPVFDEFSLVSELPCYRVNCERYRDMAQRYKIEGYPTISKTKQGAIVSTFSGPRTKEELQKWSRL